MFGGLSDQKNNRGQRGNRTLADPRGGPWRGLGRFRQEGNDGRAADFGSGLCLQILDPVFHGEEKGFARAKGKRNIETGRASVASVTEAGRGGAVTTVIFSSRNHFHMPVRSEADDHGPWISDAKEKPDQGNRCGDFLVHAISIQVVHIRWTIIIYNMNP